MIHSLVLLCLFVTGGLLPIRVHLRSSAVSLFFNEFSNSWLGSGTNSYSELDSKFTLSQILTAISWRLT
jgi:hypothetical protein